MIRNYVELFQHTFDKPYINGDYLSKSNFLKPSVFLEIPVEGKFVEIPAFAMPLVFKHPDRLFKRGLDNIALILAKEGNANGYKTFDNNLKESLQHTYSAYGLRSVLADETSYFVTNGAIFSSSYTPLLQCSWVFEKGQRCYSAVSPIVRISPDVMVNPSNPMERFIAKKAFKLFLENNFDFPFFSVAKDDEGRWEARVSRWRRQKVKIEICETPFAIRTVDAPSISTTNEELLKTALDNLEDITYDD